MRTRAASLLPRALVVLTAGLVLGACASGPPPRSSSIPEWIDNPPLDEQYLYGVGSYSGSFYPPDNRKNAQKEAVDALGRQIETHIREEIITVRRHATESTRRIAKQKVEIAVKNWEPVEMWVDEQGLVPNTEPGTVWALVRVPRSDLRAAVAAALKESEE